MSRRSRILGVIGTAAVLLTVGLAGAPLASAADRTLAITCGNGSEATPTITPGLVVGDTFTITYPTTGTVCQYMGVNFDGTIGSPLFLLTPVSGVTGAPLINGYVYTLNGSGTVVLSVSRAIAEGSFIVDIGATTGLSGGYMPLQGAVPGDGSQNPSDLLQQTGVPASGSCADVTDTAFRYGTSVSGGWGKSWANWINPGIGGAVCTRTLRYSNSLSAWVVA